MYRRYRADPVAMSAVCSLRRRADLASDLSVSPGGFLLLSKDASVWRRRDCSGSSANATARTKVSEQKPIVSEGHADQTVSQLKEGRQSGVYAEFGECECKVVKTLIPLLAAVGM